MSDNPLVHDDVRYSPSETTWVFAGPAGLLPLTEGTSEYGWWQGLPPAEKGIDLAKAIATEDWGSALIAASGAGFEVLGATLDPLGTAAGYLTTWLMEHLTPLRTLLDGLAGDPETIKAYARTWLNISTHLDKVNTSFVGVMMTGTEGWTGEAADRCRQTAVGISSMTGTCMVLTGGISKLCLAAAELVAAVRGLVRDLLGMIAGEIVAVGVELLATAGGAAPYAVQQLVNLIGRCTLKALYYYTEITSTLARIAAISNQVLGVLVAITKAWEERESSGLPD